MRLEEPDIVEVAVAAPVEAVWRSITDPKLIKQWHGWNYESGGGLEGEINEIFVKGAEADHDHHVLKVNGGDRFELSVVADLTRVRVVRAAPDAGEVARDYYDEISEGWISFLQQLRFLLEHHPGRERRTLFFGGRGEVGALDGLRSRVPVPVGKTWYATSHQQGVVLPEHGPGLLITASAPPEPDEAEELQAGAMAIISCFGLDDEDFEAQDAAWTSWWHSGYPDSGDAEF